MKNPTMTVGQLLALLEKVPHDIPIKTVYHNYFDLAEDANLNSIELLYEGSSMSMVLHIKEADTEVSNAAA